MAARVSTAATAHHDSTGICARNSEFTSPLQRRHFKLDAGEALHHGDIAERVGGGFGEIGVMPLDRALHRLGAAHHQTRQRGERDAEHRATAAPAASSDTIVAGSSTTMKTNAAKCSRKNYTHSHHSVSVPASMILICRPEWAPA